MMLQSLLTTRCTVGDLSTGDLFRINQRKFRKMITDLGQHHLCHDLANQCLTPLRLDTEVEKINELETEPLEID